MAFIFLLFINVLAFSLDVNYRDDYSTFKPGITTMQKGKRLNLDKSLLQFKMEILQLWEGGRMPNSNFVT